MEVHVGQCQCYEKENIFIARVSFRVNNLIGHRVEIGCSHEACRGREGWTTQGEEGGVGVWDWLFPDIRNMLNVNTSRGDR